MSSQIDEPTVAISLRVPGNILQAIKLRAKADGKKVSIPTNRTPLQKSSSEVVNCCLRTDQGPKFTDSGETSKQE